MDALLGLDDQRHGVTLHDRRGGSHRDPKKRRAGHSLDPLELLELRGGRSVDHRGADCRSRKRAAI